MKYKGLIIGMAFCISSILLTLTIVGPVYITIFAEKLGKLVDDSLKIGNISGTTFYTCTAICILVYSIYMLSLVKFRQNALIWLTIFFISIFIFGNAALFYYDIRLPDAQLDGQQGMNSLDIPIKTCWLYVVFGLSHDLLINKLRKAATQR
jgi:hypothetical protein